MRILVSFLLFPLYSFAQDIEKLNSNLDSLKKEQLKVSKHLEVIESAIKKTNQEIFERETKKNNGIVITIKTRSVTDIYDKKNWENKLGNILPNTTLTVYEDNQSSDGFKYYLVSYNGVSGIVFRTEVETQVEEQYRLAKEETILKEQRIQLEILQEKYGKTNGERVFKNMIWLGMTREMIIDSWGKPNDINKTVGSWGVHEQWIYNTSYLYIENGTLTSWQD